MGGDFSGKNQDCSKGIYALAGETLWSAGFSQASWDQCVVLYFLQSFVQTVESVYLVSQWGFGNIRTCS